MKHIIVNNNKYRGLLACDPCEAEIITIVRKTLTSCFIELDKHTINNRKKQYTWMSNIHPSIMSKF